MRGAGGTHYVPPRRAKIAVKIARIVCVFAEQGESGWQIQPFCTECIAIGAKTNNSAQAMCFLMQ